MNLADPGTNSSLSMKRRHWRLYRWGKTTTLGGSLGFVLGAKLANPDKTVINLMGDASMGMAGFDFEAAIERRFLS